MTWIVFGVLAGFALAFAVIIAYPGDMPSPAPFLFGFSLTMLGGLIGKAASLSEDPTEAQIMEAFGWSYTHAGVDRIMDQERSRLATREGRRALYGRALALAGGVFS